MTPADLAELERLTAFFDRVLFHATADRERIDELERRLAELEGGTPTPEPGGELPRVPFTFPPLKYNPGSWDKYADTGDNYHVVLDDGSLEIHVEQKAQPAQRVLRRDFGLQDPAQEVGRGGFLREPANRLRRYELKIHVPEDYDGAGEMCNLFQWHTSSARRPPYLSFFLWSKSAYLRHNRPDETREDYKLGPIKKGHTYHVAVDAIWTSQSWKKGFQGVLRASVDGKEIFDYVGPTFRDEEDEAPYVVFGPYYPSAKAPFKVTFTFSDLRIGDI